MEEEIVEKEMHDERKRTEQERERAITPRCADSARQYTASIYVYGDGNDTTQPVARRAGRTKDRWRIFSTLDFSHEAALGPAFARGGG